MERRLLWVERREPSGWTRIDKNYGETKNRRVVLAPPRGARHVGFRMLFHSCTEWILFLMQDFKSVEIGQRSRQRLWIVRLPGPSLGFWFGVLDCSVPICPEFEIVVRTWQTSSLFISNSYFLDIKVFVVSINDIQSSYFYSNTKLHSWLLAFYKTAPMCCYVNFSPILLLDGYCNSNKNFVYL